MVTLAHIEKELERTERVDLTEDTINIDSFIM